MPQTRKEMPRAPLLTPDAWYGSELQSRDNWRYRLTRDDVSELLRAHETARATGKPMKEWTRADFPLPKLSQQIHGWLAELDLGRGFILLKGFPVASHDEQTCAEIYWGIGLHMGRAVPQNTDGDLLGHVRDTGADPNAYGVRLYKTRAEQDFHTDGADIIGLFCLKPAKSGGISRIVSSVTVFNELAKRAPELVPVLFQTFPFDTQGQHKPGQKPWFDFPLCHFENGRLRTFFIPWYIRESQQHPEAPRLSDAQSRAIATIETIANEPGLYLDMNFEPGDMQFLKNAAVLHKRTEYEDFEAPQLKRHLLRLWLSEPSFTAGDTLLRKGVIA